MNSSLLVDILQKASVGIALLSIDGRFLSANEALASALGEKATDLIGKRFIDFSHPFEWDRERKSLLRLGMGLSSSYTTEKRVVHKNGEVFWKSFEIKPVPDAVERGISHLVLVSHDVTARVKAETRVRIAEAQARSFFKTDLFGVLHFGPNGSILDANEAFLRLMDRTREEVQRGDLSLRDLTSEDWRGLEEKMLGKLKSGQPSVNYFKEGLCADGRKIPLVVSASLLDPEDSMNGVAFIQDLSELFEARRIAEENQTKVNLALEAANIGIWEYLPETHEISWDAKTSTFFGLPYAEKVTPEFFKSLVHEEDQARVWATMKSLAQARSNSSQGMEFRVPSPQGERILSVTGRGFDGGDGVRRRAIGTVVDITESKLAEQRLSENEERFRTLADEMKLAKEAAEKADQMKSSFLANMSHEIRTPLGAILGFTELLADPETDETEKEEFVQIVSRNGHSLSRIVDDILDLSKVEAGLLKVEKARISPRMVVSDSVALFQERARAKNLVVEYKMDPNTPEWVFSDSIRLRQILSNLISNAIKFTERGGVTVNVSTESKDWLSVTVCDTGIGIGREQISKLFQPFSQGDDSMSRRFGGTGLGLHLSRKLSEAMGGCLDIESSEPGHGTCFRLRIPVGEPVDASVLNIPVQLRESPKTKADLELPLLGKSILVVDDSKDNQHLIERFLAKKGADVDFADNGLIAVERALNANYDLILMDLQMPEMDGFEATETLRQEQIQTPIIALTAHVVEEVRRRCKTVGCNGFLPKPIQPTDLVRIVIEHLRK